MHRNVALQTEIWVYLCGFWFCEVVKGMQCMAFPEIGLETSCTNSSRTADQGGHAARSAQHEVSCCSVHQAGHHGHAASRVGPLPARTVFLRASEPTCLDVGTWPTAEASRVPAAKAVDIMKPNNKRDSNDTNLE